MAQSGSLRAQETSGRPERSDPPANIPARALTCADYAEMLLDRATPGDREEAIELQDEAIAVAQEPEYLVVVQVPAGAVCKTVCRGQALRSRVKQPPEPAARLPRQTVV